MEIAAGEMAVAVYYLTVVTVFALAATKGGRFERTIALVMGVASVANFVLQFLLKQLVPIVPFTVIDLLVLLAIVRTWWRYPRLWTSAAALFQVISVAFDGSYLLGLGPPERLYMTLLNATYYAIFGSIAFGVLRRRIGPPFPLPSASRVAGRHALPHPIIHALWLHKR